ncbi:NmrA/HSCARG family protein [Chondromyces crocatus]|uniref:NmrA family protein n=1 Tax=Chondromyces crocatus TaxID=52 RepID=A0A0K1EAD2_CHOCO|nr:NmrA/HSCARG family protein [Chondromyces crocatus]AKT37814.1 NmrA family protein [Chondromyces crocatus]
MTQSEREILVTGATGAQGGAVVRHLLQRGYRVRALCRDPQKPAAKALSEAGVRVLQGDFDDAASLAEATRGVYGVFGVQNFWDGFPGPCIGLEHEVRQGKALLDAAKAADVRHFVQASAGGAAATPCIPSTESKRRIELHAKAIGIPWTFVRSVFFMDNLVHPAWGFMQPILEGRLELSLAPETRLQVIAVDDIGHFVGMAFDRPREFVGSAFDLAGDELSMLEMAAVFSRVMGKEIRFTGSLAGLERVKAFSEELASVFRWAHEVGFGAFIPGLRALHPGLSTLEAFLRRAGWEGRGGRA